MAVQTVASLIVGLDVGTSSVRAIVFDRQGQRLPDVQAAAQHTPRSTPDGGAEFGAEEVLQRAVQVIRAVIAQCGSAARQVVAVGISMFWHSLVGVDGQGHAVTPVYMWSDLRSAQQARLLQQRLDENRIQARTGCVLHPMYMPAKILWVRHTHATALHACQFWLSLPAYFALRLFGEPLWSLSMASGSGLFDLWRCTWDDELLEALDITPQQLGIVADTPCPLYRLRQEFHTLLRPLGGVPWCLPVGDGACSNVGSGSATDQTMGLTIGTSAALRVITRQPLSHVPAGLWGYRLDRQRLILGGALNNGGNLYAWLREQLRLDDAAQLEQQLAALVPDAHGLTVLPFLIGERNPYWSLTTPAAIVGLRPHTRPVDIVQACLEAVAYRLALIHMRLSAILPTQRLLVSGGVLASPAWLQVLADVLETSLIAVAETEAACRGAALLALEALGACDDVADVPVQTAATYTPSTIHQARYRRARERHEQLYQRLQGFLDLSNSLEQDAKAP
jgi:gluconokinase